ncbi:MAG: hypothetical protein ACE5JF_02165 [Anaerolineales bacterium]
MNNAISDNRLKLLERTLMAALISSGIVAISAAVLQVDALIYMLLAIGAALIGSAFVGVPKRFVKFVAARRGPSYVGFFLIFLPIAIMLVAIMLGALLWLGISSGILELADYFIPVIGLLITILINIAILIYNVIEIRRNS